MTQLLRTYTLPLYYNSIMICYYSVYYSIICTAGSWLLYSYIHIICYAAGSIELFSVNSTGALV